MLLLVNFHTIFTCFNVFYQIRFAFSYLGLHPITCKLLVNNLQVKAFFSLLKRLQLRVFCLRSHEYLERILLCQDRNLSAVIWQRIWQRTSVVHCCVGTSSLHYEQHGCLISDEQQCKALEGVCGQQREEDRGNNW